MIDRDGWASVYWVYVLKNHVPLPMYMEAKARKMIQEFSDSNCILVPQKLAEKYGCPTVDGYFKGGILR